MSRMELTSLHLSRIGQLYPQPLLELGPNIVEIPEEFSDIVDEQLTAAGVLESADTLAAPARALLDPLFGYDQAFAAVLMLHNQRQRVTFDLDEEWFDYIGSTSIPTTPRVYVLVTATGSTVTTAVRAGDHVDVVRKWCRRSFRRRQPRSSCCAWGIQATNGRLPRLRRCPSPRTCSTALRFARRPPTARIARHARITGRPSTDSSARYADQGVSSRTVSTVETILGARFTLLRTMFRTS
ncbi:hypothetical protein GS489_31030, partial [Rhodococcus hoagii]|nr:hypothetical protein [Prescottella equi]